MHAAISLSDSASLATVLGGAVAFLVAAGGVARWALRAELAAYFSKPDGINSRLEHIEYQLRPNSGKSLRDRVDAAERTSRDTEQAIGELDARVIHVEAQLKEIGGQVSEIRELVGT